MRAIGGVEEFEGFDTEIHDAITKRLNFPDDWPDGLLCHAAGPRDTGAMCITDRWQSAAPFQRFVETKLQPTMQAVLSERGTPPPGGPPKTMIFQIHNTVHAHA